MILPVFSEPLIFYYLDNFKLIYIRVCLLDSGHVDVAPGLTTPTQLRWVGSRVRAQGQFFDGNLNVNVNPWDECREAKGWFARQREKNFAEHAMNVRICGLILAWFYTN